MALAVVPRETADVAMDATIHQLPLELITVGPNVRVKVEGIEELAASVGEHGVVQPIKVRHAADGAGYEIVWGQRRFLASRMAGRTEIPAIIDDTAKSEAELAIEQLVENLAREDLPALDRARAMKAVVDAGVTQADLARQLGLAASTISNDLGLLEAPAKIRGFIEDGKLSPAHAKALKGLEAKTQVELAQQAIADGWSAHELEGQVQYWRERAERTRQVNAEAENVTAAHQAALHQQLVELAAKVPLSTPIVVSGYSYGENGKKAIDAAVLMVGAQGFAVTKGHGNDRPKGFCDCTAYRVEVGWSGDYKIRPTCVVDGHYKAKQRAESEAWQAKNDLENRVRAKLAEVLVAEVAQLPRLAARLACWRLLGWEIEDWAKRHDPARTGKKRNPWATLAEAEIEDLRAEVARRLAQVHDGNFKVDWHALAAELGIEAPAK